jgi:prepilin-type processing-associated H-X9-DG protein
MKQIGLGFRMYTQDYDETWITSIQQGSGPLAIWMARLDPYIKNGQVFICPSGVNTGEEEFYWPSPIDSTFTTVKRYGYSYRPNRAVLGQLNDINNNTQKGFPLSDASVPRQADTIIFGDSPIAANEMEYGQIDRGGTSGAGAMSTWRMSGALDATGYPVRASVNLGATQSYFTTHQGMVNFVFGDGHAKAMKVRNTFGSFTNETQMWGLDCMDSPYYDPNNPTGWVGGIRDVRLPRMNEKQK